MEAIKLWARHGDAVRQAIELGALVHLATASEELTDEFLLFAIASGLLQSWATALPDPRPGPAIGMEVMIAAHWAARCGRTLCDAPKRLWVACGLRVGRPGLQRCSVRPCAGLIAAWALG